MIFPIAERSQADEIPPEPGPSAASSIQTTRKVLEKRQTFVAHQNQTSLKIFRPIFGRHERDLGREIGWRKFFGNKHQLQVIDNSIDFLIVHYKSNDRDLRTGNLSVREKNVGWVAAGYRSTTNLSSFNRTRNITSAPETTVTCWVSTWSPAVMTTA